METNDQRLTTNDVITFGCRLNAYESQVIKDALAQSGASDVAVFNTCAVTREAERQARQSIRKFRRENPDKKIIVTGCAAQINPDTYAQMKEVDKVIGNEEKLSARSYGNDFIADTEKVKVNDIMSVKETALHLVEGLDGKARAFMQVQNGCNHRCTFCIIPYGRGNSRSAPIGEVVAQAKLLVEKGYNEIVLTGVDMTDYGKDLPGTPTLGQMVRRLLSNVPELKRLRLSSVDVAEIDEDLRDLIATEQRLMPYLHLSLQSGDNMILKRMKRRHTREQVIDFCDWARKVRPDISFGADIIAGFPTETEEMFENSLDIVRRCGISFLHVFPYSEREGTPAAKIPADKQVPKQIRKERAARLRAEGENELKKFLQKQIGKNVAAIVEKDNIARTENFALVEIENCPEGNIGNIVSVNISAANNNSLSGKILA